MTATDNFFSWFYTGLNGLGGWFIFLLLALAAVIWLLYDSTQRRLPALGWKLGAVLVAALLLPAVLFRFSSPETQISLTSFVEWIFYLGLLGGIVPPVLAVGYYITYQDMVGCPEGHVYEAQFGECPECARLRTPPPPIAVAATPVMDRAPASQAIQPPPAVAPPPPRKEVVHAWLIAEDGRSYQLYAGQTTIGKSSQNDIHMTGDTTVSRNHAKIIEQNGRFKLIDVGSTNGTRVNGRLVQSETLVHDDVVQLGDNTHLRFVSGR